MLKIMTFLERGKNSVDFYLEKLLLYFPDSIKLLGTLDKVPQITYHKNRIKNFWL